TVWDRIMEDQSALNLKRGYALMEAENYPAAADEFFRAAQKNPSSPWPRLLYGSALYWLGEPDKALDEFEEALRLDPRSSMAFQLRGIVRARAGDYAAALEDFLAAERLDPSRPDVKMNAGSVYQALGNRGKALDYFRGAVQADPSNPLYRYQLGLFYSRSGRYPEAAAQLEKAVSLFPGYEDAVLELAVLRERDGQLPAAIKLYRRALAIKPRDSVARFRLAWALAKAGRDKEISKALEGAFLLAPPNEKGGISMGLAYTGGAERQPGAAAPPAGGPLMSALSRIPPEQEAKVGLEMLETPKAVLPEHGAAGGEGKLALALKRPRVSYTKREYFLPASAPEERLKRINEISAEAEKLMKSVSSLSDARLNFGIETSVPAGKSEEKKKPLYVPRDVGNDMGLWIMGDSWLENVGEAVEEMDEHPAGRKPGLRTVRGLGYLLLGEAARALDDFDAPGVQAALGRSAAWVAAGDTARALAACLDALKLEPENATARSNRSWLEVKK
ncbi:MAG TPA: hypothetical protein DEO67_00695, partial [Candidatus Edwardsbacteria bacterium]|nr:hypothetical protein [Candidatus Edwardsbacteria bacterium]